MIFKNIEADIEVVDSDFDLIYSKRIQGVSEMHFTPVSIAKVAAFYLADKKGVRILDIGSGAGKFCMIGSACTEGYFVGVEQRNSLCLAAKGISKKYHLTNVEFIHSNIMDIAFEAYDAFYFFNAFYEHIGILGRMDTEIELNRALYDEYSAYVKVQLDGMPIGTKLVTYYSYLNEIPASYVLVFSNENEKLKFWEKKN
jgi:SAM-dependent methyltransferase